MTHFHTFQNETLISDDGELINTILLDDIMFYRFDGEKTTEEHIFADPYEDEDDGFSEALRTEDHRWLRDHGYE